MPPRSFTVYIDTPSTVTETVRSNATPIVPTETASITDILSSRSISDIIPVANKENFNPLTGERVTYSTGKKRKTSVLATKACTPLEAKELKDCSDSQPETKKRKASSSSTSRVKGRKEGKKSGSKAKKSSRRASPLPRVEEESDAEGDKGKEAPRLAQAEIDSKCYDLTVKPLADVSEAYDEATSLTRGFFEEEASGDEKTYTFVKGSSLEPQIRDYFSPVPESGPTGMPSRSSSRAPSQEPKVFTTPERKEIYSSFTFTTPSPTSQRFKKTTRSASVPRLDLDTAVNTKELSA